MAAVIKKLNINIYAINSARVKLQSSDESELNVGEAKAILQLIKAGRSALFPQLREIEQYQYAIDQLGHINRNTNPDQFDHYAGQIESFEKKYCE